MRIAMLCRMSFFLMFLSAALGQSGAPHEKSAGFVFAAPGALVAGNGFSEGVVHLGAGAEGLVHGGFGLGADLGYLFPFDGKGIGVFSPGVLYQFHRQKKTVPIATGGYTLIFRSGVAHLIHFGGGVNHWINDRWGLRVEGRDHLDPNHPDLHILQVRIGIVFR